MQIVRAELTEWLNSQETRILVAYLKTRQAGAVAQFLSGYPVDQAMQAKAAGFHEIELLLTMPTESVKAAFETALKGN